MSQRKDEGRGVPARSSKGVVDLDRERRVRVQLNGLRDLLADDPDLAERTQEMLAGELPCSDLEDEMTERPLESVRLPSDLMERAEALVPLMKQDGELAAFGRVSKSAVVRLALHRGLVSLEDQYSKKKGKK